MFEKLTKLTESFIEKGIPGNDCSVYFDGREVYRHFSGYSDLEKEIPMNGRERYNIYSCSKPITCAAALQLLERGKIALDDKLYEYIPEFKDMCVRNGDEILPAKKYITIKDLFCMTAGLRYLTTLPCLLEAKEKTDGKCPTVETVKYLVKEPLKFEPGDRWEYSFCHDVLAAVVEIVSGERFGKYVQKHIFEPLEMEHSTFLLPDEEVDSLCAQYRYNEQTKVFENCGKQIWSFKLGSEYESGGAGCISTVDDYMKFLEAMRKGDIILKEETIQLMSANMLNEPQKESFWEAQKNNYRMRDYGYGLGVRCPDEKKGTTDFGWGGAAGGYLAVDRKNKITIFYAQHVLLSPIQSIRGQVYTVAKEELLHA